MLQGMTAHYLTRSTYPLAVGQTCLVHAAAGGAGGMIVQMARLAGARVLGTASTEAKADEARALGAEHVIIYTEQDFEAEVKRLTDGRGVDVVYDSVGQSTFDKSLKVLAAARPARPVRPVERPGRAGRSDDSEHARLRVPDASEPGALPRHARRTALARQ